MEQIHKNLLEKRKSVYHNSLGLSYTITAKKHLAEQTAYAV